VDLKAIRRDLLDFFFPRRCPFCGRILGRELLCSDCEKALPYTGAQAVRKGAFGVCASPLWYEGAVRDALLRFKFRRDLGVLACFGEMMARCAAEELMGEFDAVTWVPVSTKRLRKRGFDQSRLLAASLCVDWHVQPIRTLRKISDNPAQSGISDAAARRANVLGVYECAEPQIVSQHRWLLVDDICTTGATLQECVRVLKAAGAPEVVCLTLASVRRR